MPAPLLHHHRRVPLTPRRTHDFEQALPGPPAGQRVFTAPDIDEVRFIRSLRDDFLRLQMEHQSGIDAILTKVETLRRESLHLHRYNPIEHVTSRVKSPESILEKALRREVPLDPESIRSGLTDIAGVRITCSFISDAYRLLESLTSQPDVKVIAVKDYIAEPKPNGYQSLHAIVEVPVFLSSGDVPVTVELQIRTIAMDFWASLDHKIHYKYHGKVPSHLSQHLKEAAEIVTDLDRRMEQFYNEVHGESEDDGHAGVTIEGFDEELLHKMWRDLGRMRPESKEIGAPHGPAEPR